MLDLASFSASLKLEPPAFKNEAMYPKSQRKVQRSYDHPMSWPSWVKLGPCAPDNRLSDVPHPLTLHCDNVLSTITQPYVSRLPWNWAWWCCTGMQRLQSCASYPIGCEFEFQIY